SGDSDFHILQNGSEIYTRQVAPSSGGSVSQTLSAYAGDTIDFVVGRGADGRESGSGLKIQASLTLLTTNSPPSCAEISTGLVGWWPFDTNVNDIAGGASTSAQGDPAFVPGKVAAALSFDGTDDSVTALASSALNVGVSNGMSIEGWIKPGTVAYQ